MEGQKEAKWPTPLLYIYHLMRTLNFHSFFSERFDPSFGPGPGCRYLIGWTTGLDLEACCARSGLLGKAVPLTDGGAGTAQIVFPALGALPRR